MTDDRTADDTQDQEAGPPPELADWWVWGVRRVAAVVADLLLAARVIPLLFAVLKGAIWVLARDPNELWEPAPALRDSSRSGAGACCWDDSPRSGDSPDPERWLLRHQRAARVTPPGSRCLYCGGIAGLAASSSC